MKKNKYIYLLIFFITLFIPKLAFADASSSSVYQTVINYLVQNDGNFYSQYVNNKHCIVLDVTQFQNSSFWGFSYSNSTYAQVWYNRTQVNSNAINHADYIALFFDDEIKITENLGGYSQSSGGTTYYADFKIEQYSNTKVIKGIAILANGNVSNISLGTASNPFFFESGISVIWHDDDLSYYDTNNNKIATYLSSNYTLNPTQVAITGNETQSEMYQKVMSFFNANANFYANIWASGNKPTVCILDNRNRDIIASLYNSSNIANYDFIALLYPERLTAYIQNNNSVHYNLFALNEQCFLMLIDIGTQNNITFYRYSNITTQRDIAVTTSINDRIFFCNTDIYKRYNSSNFELNNNGSFVNFYSSVYENAPVYPINSNATTSSGASSVWERDDITNINDKINNINTNTSALLDISSFNLSSILTNAFSSLSSLAPFHFITDFLSDVSNCYQDALNKAQNASFSWDFELMGIPLHFAPYDVILNNLNLITPFLNLSFFIGLIFLIYKNCIKLFSSGGDD